MAGELKTTGSLNFSKGGATLVRALSGTITVAGTNYVSGTATIATSDGTLPLGAIGTIGLVQFKNLDGTNYVDIGSDGTVYPIRIFAGEPAGPFRWNGAAVHCKAHTASIQLQYDIIEA